jgi:hypothetical protein
MDELKIARRFQLEGSRWEAARHLGRALHYIHDSCTGKGLLGLSHERVESALSLIDLPKDAIERGINEFKPHPTKLKKALRELSPSNNPKEVLWNATYYSALAVKSVITLGDLKAAVKEVEHLNSMSRKTSWIVTAFNLLLLGILLVTNQLKYMSALGLSLLAFSLPLHFLSKREEIKDWFRISDKGELRKAVEKKITSSISSPQLLASPAIFCSNCGTRLQPDYIYCHICGKKVKA